MKRWRISLLGVLCSFFLVNTLRADPIVTLGATSQQPTIPWGIDPKTGMPETLSLATNNGTFQGHVFLNDTQFRFADLEFTFSARPTPATGDGGPFFDSAVGTTTTLAFSGGAGIAPGGTFTITATDFGALISVTPSIVPEPSSLGLTVIGAMGTIIFCRRRGPVWTRIISKSDV